jgi:DNA-binding transcriptional regulator YbjK
MAAPTFALNPTSGIGAMIKWGLNRPEDGRVYGSFAKVPCELFAEAGFHGTHLREICKRARTNVAGVSYYFHSKEGLYAAVTMERKRNVQTIGENCS